MEQKLCEELAALAAGFDVANDPSAKGLPSGRCSVRLRETAMYVAAASGQETTMDYDTLLVERDHASKSFQNAMDCGALPAPGVKCQLVQGGAASGNPETDRPFDDSLAPGAESHVFLARAARPVASDAAHRVGAAPLKFQQAVEAAAPHAAVLVLLGSGGRQCIYTRGFQYVHDFPDVKPVRERRREEERDFARRLLRVRTFLSRARPRATSDRRRRALTSSRVQSFVTAGAAHAGEKRFEGEKIGFVDPRQVVPLSELEHVLGRFIIAACV